CFTRPSTATPRATGTTPPGNGSHCPPATIAPCSRASILPASSRPRRCCVCPYPRSVNRELHNETFLDCPDPGTGQPHCPCPALLNGPAAAGHPPAAQQRAGLYARARIRVTASAPPPAAA